MNTITRKPWLLVPLALLVALYSTWFRDERAALLVFALPCALAAIGVAVRRRTAGFWAGVLALLWFSHGVMVAWTRTGERGYALAETALALWIVLAASIPGLRARFAARRAG